ncbi:MAG TPA: UDP-3-O-acyl-N-acetylglucosamine deacetylase, partial [Vicinamibacteria bacterium]|nr:UDP-3-O-acyl-N-acetylglucosamine deacetylase [Vicinamibacteria bacterium]
IVFANITTAATVPAHLDYVSSTGYATTLHAQGMSVGTVEHLLAALSALGVDDVLVEVDGPEVPVLDGSAAPFVMLLHEAGLRPLAVPRHYLRVRQAVEVVHGQKSARLVPAEHFEVRYTIGFDHPLLRHQALSLRLSGRAFTDSIAPARTFGFLREVELLRKSGLALGGSLDNAVVIGESGVLNNKLRFPDEFVRHKILDAIGDLALLGHPLLGRLEAVRAGHALHAAVARKLLATAEAFELVPATAALGAEPALVTEAAALHPAAAY